MAVFLRSLLFFLTLLSAALSVPTAESNTQSSLRLHDPYAVREHAFGPFRKLRDTIIEKLWSIPHKSIHHSSTTSSPPTPELFRARYGNDVVLRFQLRTEDDAKALLQAADILFLDIWEGTNEWVDIRVAKDIVPSFIGLLPASLHQSYTPLMHDLARTVYDTYPGSASSDDDAPRDGPTPSHNWRSTVQPSQNLFFHDFQPLSVLYPWLRLITSLFPTHASLITIGMSAEGRDIPALRLGTQKDYARGDDHTTRHTLIIAGGTHAREWISVSTAAYIAHSLVTRYGHAQYPHVTKLLDHFDVVVIPVLNPDGYEYTWTTDRLWRKNRQATDIAFCPGIDIDRSFSFGWNGQNSRDNACSDDYAGTEPLTALEARVLTEWARNETENNNVTFDAYLDLHSYSQEVLYPYSYSCDVEPPNLEDLEEVAMGLAKSFRLTNGHYYGVESACEGSITFKDQMKTTRVQADSQGGSALDFFYHDLNVKFAYQIKLRDTGTYGFLLPRSQIVPTGEETYEAVVGLGRWLLGNHGIESIGDRESVWGVDPNPVLTQKKKTTATVLESGEDAAFDDELAFELRRRKKR